MQGRDHSRNRHANTRANLDTVLTVRCNFVLAATNENTEGEGKIYRDISARGGAHERADGERLFPRSIIFLIRFLFIYIAVTYRRTVNLRVQILYTQGYTLYLYSIIVRMHPWPHVREGKIKKFFFNGSKLRNKEYF